MGQYIGTCRSFTCRYLQVGFIQDDDRFDPKTMHCQQVALQQVTRGQRLRCDNNQNLVEIRGNDMLALTFICPYKIVLTWLDTFNHQGAFICLSNHNPVTTIGSSNPSTVFAAFTFTVRQEHNTLAAIGHQNQGF